MISRSLLVMAAGVLLRAVPSAADPLTGLLVGGWGLPYIAAYSPDGQECWRIPTDGKQIDVWLMDNGNVLYTYNGGVREVRRDPASPQNATVIWDHKAAQGAEIDGCQPLGSDRILISESRNGRIDLVELERGTLAEKIRVAITGPGVGDAHGNSRQVRKTAQGTYLFGLMNGQGGREYDAQGKMLHQFPDVRFSLQKLSDGTYLGAGGDSRCIIGFDAEAKESWRIKAEDIPGFTIGFAAAVTRLGDGTLLVANWGGHGNAAGPCIGRISADRTKLLWSLRIVPANSIAGFQVIPAQPAAPAQPVPAEQMSP